MNNNNNNNNEHNRETEPLNGAFNILPNFRSFLFPLPADQSHPCREYGAFKSKADWLDPGLSGQCGVLLL